MSISTSITYLPIVDSTVRLANLKSGGLDLIERLHATDIEEVRDDSRLKLSTAPELGYQGSRSISPTARSRRTRSARHAKVRQALELAIDRDAINQVVFNGEFVPGNQWISPEQPLLSEASRCRSATSPRPRR